MSEVLYRKWRPTSLSELMGQEHITQTLKNAISSKRFAHAYLFCGPRGTGKTSAARILAKAINCLMPNEGEPCNKCVMCTNINEGRALDLIEIDGASNRRIADIRDLTEKIHYSPGQSEFKVYIIDEVHMLTQEAFNALLKTLEEPPSHAILILATTDVQKMPLTIVSRCQRFDFKRVDIEVIVKKLKNLCIAESVDVDIEALKLIATKATGSLRDAENLLEQAIVTFDTNISESDVKEMLNIAEDSLSLNILELIVNNDLPNSLIALSEMVNRGIDPKQIHISLLDSFRSLMLLKSGAIFDTDLNEELTNKLLLMQEKINLKQLLFIVKTLSSVTFTDVISSVFPLEMALVEINIGETTIINTKIKQDQYTSNESKYLINKKPSPIQNNNSSSLNSSKPIQINRNMTNQTTNRSESITSANTLRDGESGKLDNEWPNILRALRQTGNRFKLGALFRGSSYKEIDNNVLIIRFSHASHIERIKSELDNKLIHTELLNIVEQIIGVRYEVSIELDANQSGNIVNKFSGQDSPIIKAAQAMGARIVEERRK